MTKEFPRPGEASGRWRQAAMPLSRAGVPGPADGAAWDGGSLPLASRAFLDSVVRLQLLTPSAVHDFLDRHTNRFTAYASADALSHDLIQAGLLTPYQVERLRAGNAHGLVLGNHRILGCLGVGGMGTVFLAEHLFMKRRAAVKVLPVDADCPPVLIERFYSEMRVLAGLRHPHIVMAYDAGMLAPPQPGLASLLYLAVELVPGGDLEQYVTTHGPVSVAQACDWACQAASGLQEAHDAYLIHRDVKPSNLLLGPDGKVKLVDFGLVRQLSSKLTDPRTLLGTVECMAPEQSRDPSAVGSQVDIYGLGATLFWLLTAEYPHPPSRSVAEALRRLQTTRPRRLRTLRPSAPRELEALLERMMDHDPGRRPALPLTVINALLPFCQASSLGQAAS
jgi:serine/threonine-protein kinase